MCVWVEPTGGQRKSADIEWKTVTLIYPYPTEYYLGILSLHLKQTIFIANVIKQYHSILLPFRGNFQGNVAL
jgi:hypothetical protein